MSYGSSRKKHTFTGSIDEVFAGIRDYDSYPEYLPGVTQVQVLPAQETGSICQVRYDLNLVKKFYYILNMYEESPHKIWWDLAESNLMKENAGSWTLKGAKKASTEANYQLEVKFKGLIPSAVTDKIAKANLPAMFAGFQELIDSKR
ncbi:MAG: SRPBCC family protein [Bdellovibrionota bacterium]